MARACASSFFVGDSSAGARPGTSARRAPDGAEGAAEYPARSTASQMSSSERAASSKVTRMLPDSRLTETSATPSSLQTAFSTCAWHAAQVMPPTSNVR